MDGLSGIRSNGGVVVNEWGFEAVKSKVVSGPVIGRCTHKPRKVVSASRDINGLKEVCKEFVDLFEIVISGCSNNC